MHAPFFTWPDRAERNSVTLSEREQRQPVHRVIGNLGRDVAARPSAKQLSDPVIAIGRDVRGRLGSSLGPINDRHLRAADREGAFEPSTLPSSSHALVVPKAGAKGARMRVETPTRPARPLWTASWILRIASGIRPARRDAARALRPVPSSLSQIRPYKGLADRPPIFGEFAQAMFQTSV